MRRFNFTTKRKGSQNQLESLYESDVLKPLYEKGEILTYRYEALTFRLAKRTTYTPDFVVIYPDRIELHEVKGFATESGRVKWKIAAETYPWFTWKYCTKKRNRWNVETYV